MPQPYTRHKDHTMAITDWPEGERPREKLLALGADELSDSELLAIFLRTGVTGKTAVDLANDLLSTFGSLRALLEADQAQFCAANGLGPAKFAQLQAVLAMARRHTIEELKQGAQLTKPEVVVEFLMQELRDYPYELFACLYLDAQNQLIHFSKLFRGTINMATVYPREVVIDALHHKACKVILAHNHPSGVAEPSMADQEITQRLKEALALVDIRVLDHIIVGNGQYTSFAERGDL